MRGVAARFGSVSGASRYDRCWPRLRARHTSALWQIKHRAQLRIGGNHLRAGGKSIIPRLGGVVAAAAPAVNQKSGELRQMVQQRLAFQRAGGLEQLVNEILRLSLNQDVDKRLQRIRVGESQRAPDDD